MKWFGPILALAIGLLYGSSLVLPFGEADGACDSPLRPRARTDRGECLPSPPVANIIAAIRKASSGAFGLLPRAKLSRSQEIRPYLVRLT